MFRGSEDAKKGVGLEYSNLQAHSTPRLSTPILSREITNYEMG